jgi:hypothetical protein
MESPSSAPDIMEFASLPDFPALARAVRRRLELAAPESPPLSLTLLFPGCSLPEICIVASESMFNSGRPWVALGSTEELKLLLSQSAQIVPLGSGLSSLLEAGSFNLTLSPAHASLGYLIHPAAGGCLFALVCYLPEGHAPLTGEWRETARGVVRAANGVAARVVAAEVMRRELQEMAAVR